MMGLVDFIQALIRDPLGVALVIGGFFAAGYLFEKIGNSIFYPKNKDDSQP